MLVVLWSPSWHGLQSVPQSLNVVAQVSDLWVSYHNTEDGVSSVSLSLPHVVGIDARPWVLEEHSLVISAGSCSAHSLQLLLS